ncbi:MAG: CBS domain-containing protein [Pseudomonadales bacterium]|nr:CBS domain-containing protein [Pseudomonadales bacterium]MCP5184605.1 CBS domain-containing protein [Pseudomonadales bacterium]
MSEQRPASDDARRDSPRRSVFDWFVSLFSDEPETRAELLEMLRDAADRQLVDPGALSIIYGAIGVSEMQARDIMIPRSQLAFVREDDELDEMLKIIVESQHSRFPVVGDDLDDVKGILHAKDLLRVLQSGDRDGFQIKDYMRQATVIPESKRLNVLLEEFRANRNHMAMVVDEYGQVAGVVTIEDVLEQIVGEIEDEHDVDDVGAIKPMADGAFVVKAETTIEDFNESFGSSLPDDEFDTIGGFVLRAFGRLPRRGDRISVDGFDFRVLNADSRRLRLLRVRRAS